MLQAVATYRIFRLTPGAFIYSTFPSHGERLARGAVALEPGGRQDAVLAPRSQTCQRLRAGEVTIRDGTEVRLRLLQSISSATARVDERVRFEAAEDVLVDDRMMIPLGAQAWGTVIKAHKKKSFGRRGELDFTIDFRSLRLEQNPRKRRCSYQDWGIRLARRVRALTLHASGRVLAVNIPAATVAPSHS